VHFSGGNYYYEPTQQLVKLNLKKLLRRMFFDHAVMVVEAETESDKHAKYKACKANAHASVGVCGHSPKNWQLFEDLASAYHLHVLVRSEQKLDWSSKYFHCTARKNEKRT
jgi:hypothetical protein